VLGVGEAPEPRRHLGEHADGGDVRGEPTQVLAQQRLGLGTRFSHSAAAGRSSRGSRVEALTWLA